MTQEEDFKRLNYQCLQGRLEGNASTEEGCIDVGGDSSWHKSSCKRMLHKVYSVHVGNVQG